MELDKVKLNEAIEELLKANDGKGIEKLAQGITERIALEFDLVFIKIEAALKDANRKREFSLGRAQEGFANEHYRMAQTHADYANGILGAIESFRAHGMEISEEKQGTVVAPPEAEASREFRPCADCRTPFTCEESGEDRCP